MPKTQSRAVMKWILCIRLVRRFPGRLRRIRQADALGPFDRRVEPCDGGSSATVDASAGKRSLPSIS